MKNVVLGILQAIAKAFFAIAGLAVVFLLCLIWFKFFEAEGNIPLDGLNVSITLSGQVVPESMVEQLSASINRSRFTAALVLSGFSFLMVLALLPFYLVQQFLGNLTPGKWFAEENTRHLQLLAFYFIVLAIFEFAGYVAARYLLDEKAVKISIEPGYFLIGLGTLLLSYMHRQGVSLRQEADMTV